MSSASKTPIQGPLVRPRRNRVSAAVRDMVRETTLRPSNFVLPLFVTEGKGKEPIPAMPGCSRMCIATVVTEAQRAFSLGIKALALFPAIEDAKKDSRATESLNPNGLVQRCVAELKSTLPEMAVITDVAMDPYSSDGHDGYVENGEIVNDTTLEILAEMAVAQANAGADFVAPSDMMDGRVRVIRNALDSEGHTSVGIISYAAKYCSAFYGPFRDALDSAPRGGDKKTYQMDPANSREALREVVLDVEEGADIVMVKPALSYLDVISKVRQSVQVPVAAYNVSGEFAMIKAAAASNLINEKDAMMEILLSIKRAGADLIFTYFSIDAAEELHS